MNKAHYFLKIAPLFPQETDLQFIGTCFFLLLHQKPIREPACGSLDKQAAIYVR